MNPEELAKSLGRHYEEAFERVVPRDEAHRAKLEALRDRMRASNEEAARELQKLERQTATLGADPRKTETRRLNEERQALRRETDEATLAAWDEQTVLLSRIATATRAGRG